VTLFDPANKPVLWALADCATFYCSCERLFRPDLAGRPVVVLSNNDGCVVAITPEAKALGFKRGDVFFKNRDRLAEAGVAVFSSNYALYGDISRRVAMAMESVVPTIHQYSIDEAFIPLPGPLAAQAMDVGRSIVERTARWVGVPVRVGLGPTRTLAKLANHWAKRLGPVFGLEIGSPGLEDVLDQTPLTDVWGVGSRLAAKMRAMGLATARDLRDAPPAEAGRRLGVVVERTILELRGHQRLEADLMAVPRQTMVSSRSFGRKITRADDLAEALAHHCAEAGERLRREGLKAAGLSVFIGTGHFDERPFHTGATVRLPRSTDHTGDLIAAASLALSRSFRPGRAYRKAGVMLFELSDSAARPSLFGPPPEAAAGRKLMEAFDLINSRHGRGAIKYAAQGGQSPRWDLRREMLSDLSTTDWTGLPPVSA
jgi:DNA polymerase V